METTKFKIRALKVDEIDIAAEIFSKSYFKDIFFKWCVASDQNRPKIVTDYYKVYLKTRGSVAHVAESMDKKIIGASVWLPHDTDASTYEEISKIAGDNAPMFNAVADLSHLSEPPMQPFFQLVGFGVLEEARGLGVGSKLLEYHLDILDKVGIPTYLEASTPYNGDGVYAKFGYQPIGELMVFTEKAVLYPLWRNAKQTDKVANIDVIKFGKFKWRILSEDNNKILVISDEVLELKKYHNSFEKINWSNSDIRKYLNKEFLNNFTSEEKALIIETETKNNCNGWFYINGGPDSFDKVFLLSVSEVIEYFGKEKINSGNKFFIDDQFNSKRLTNYKDKPSRWFLRTPGSSSDFVATVTLEGKISMTGDFVNRESSELFNVGIRPAIWISKG
ncbi:MAG: GNAT family N-acetyltransferase [Erysipelotrichales bacterium]|nr:GNAT family N-acetyltransferase [Erysipelotrichales bacterium]